VRSYPILAGPCAAALLCALPAHGARITGISIPVNSMDASCHPLDEGVWAVSAPPYPLDTGTGIGRIIDPTSGWKFSLHDHQYVAPHVPDPSRCVLTYGFDEPAVVDQIELVEHSNGITQIEGYVGDSPDSLVSIGSIFGSLGDVTGWRVFYDGQVNLFDFDNTAAGRYFQIVIRKTSEPAGYACFQVYPRDAAGARFQPIPEPASLALLTLGVLAILRRRRPA